MSYLAWTRKGIAFRHALNPPLRKLIVTMLQQFCNEINTFGSSTKVLNEMAS